MRRPRQEIGRVLKWVVWYFPLGPEYLIIIGMKRPYIPTSKNEKYQNVKEENIIVSDMKRFEKEKKGKI